jgi:hypothetical protein
MKYYPSDYNEYLIKAKRVLKDIKRRAGNADGKHRSYKNILCLIETDQEIQDFVFWFYQESKRMKKLHPDEILAVDRINNMGPYSLFNIQLIPEHQNETKKAEDHAIQYCGRIPNDTEKYCPTCKQILSLNCFGRDVTQISKIRGNCKICSQKYKKK